MKYRNKRTGAIIDVKSRLTGSWELVEDSAVTPTPVEAEKKTAPKKKTTKKKVEEK